MAEDRPALIVSSTSWTPDEDFGILLDAIDEYERIVQAKNDQSFPNIIFVITGENWLCLSVSSATHKYYHHASGKGPQKEYYLDLIEQKSWNHTQVITMWLTADDYPKFLGRD